MGFVALHGALDSAGFDELLRVVPSAARVAGVDGQHDRGDRRADQHAADEVSAEQETGHDGEEQGQDRGELHLLDGGSRGDLDAGLVIGIGLAFQNAGDFAELTANFLNHLAGSLGDRFDQHAAEQVGQRSADQRTGQNRGVDDVQLQGSGGIVEGIQEGNHQRQRRQRSGTDREALADGSGGVADGVELIGDLADFRFEEGHLGDAARVIGDRAVGIDGNRRGDEGQHTDSRHRHAVHAAQEVGQHRGRSQHDQGSHGGNHTDGHAFGDGQRGAFLGGLGDLAGGLVVIGGVVLRQDADHDTGDDADGGGKPRGQPADVEARAGHIRAAEEEVGHNAAQHNGQTGGDPGRIVEFLVGVVAQLAHQQGRNADDAGDQADAGEDQGIIEQLLEHIGGHAAGNRFRGHKQVDAQDDRRGDRADIGFQQVGTQTGHVADVVADVVCDGRGVAGVVLGDLGLGLADEVSAHVGRLGVDAAADAVEHRDHGAAQRIAGDDHRKRHEADALDDPGGSGHHALKAQVVAEHAEDHVDDEQAEQREAADAQTHDRAALKGNLEGLAEVLGHARGVGHADVGVGGDAHADEAGAFAHRSADEEGQGAFPGDQDAQGEDDEDGDDADDLQLILDEGIRAFTDLLGDFLHAGSALFQLLDGREVDRGESQCSNRSQNDKREQG